MNNPNTSNEIKMDADSLYREEVFTDNAVGTLRRLTPVTATGETDAARAEQFVGSTQVLTTAGPLPLSFEIQADSLAGAAAAFGDAANEVYAEIEAHDDLAKRCMQSFLKARQSLGAWTKLADQSYLAQRNRVIGL